MHKRFASIAQPEKYGFAYDNSYEFNKKGSVNPDFRVYQTYGDGLTQHSGDWGITPEYFTDFMWSLAEAMLQDDELTEKIRFTLERGPSREELNFAATVIFKARDEGSSYEKKTRYFSMDELKISTSPSKQFDTRYKELKSWCDGSPEAMFRILRPNEYASGLEHFQVAHAINKWTFQPGNTLSCIGYAGEMVGWCADSDYSSKRDNARKMRDAFDCAHNVATAMHHKLAAEQELKYLRSNLECAAREKAEAEARTAAAQTAPLEAVAA